MAGVGGQFGSVEGAVDREDGHGEAGGAGGQAGHGEVVVGIVRGVLGERAQAGGADAVQQVGGYVAGLALGADGAVGEVLRPAGQVPGGEGRLLPGGVLHRPRGAQLGVLAGAAAAEDEGADQVRVFQGGGDGQVGAHGAADQDGGAGAEVVEEGGEVVALAEGARGVGGGAVAACVRGDDAVARGERRHDLAPQGVVGPARVEEDEGGGGGAGAGRRGPGVEVSEVAVAGGEERGGAVVRRGSRHDNQGVMAG